MNTLNYNVLDFGARLYDPAIARFTTPDPIMQFNNGYFAMGGNPVSMIDPTGMKSTTGHYDDVQEHGLSETPERGGGGSPVTIDGMPVYGSSAMLQHLVETEMQAGSNFNSSDITFSNYTVTAGDGTKYRTYSRSTANKIQDVLYQHADKLSGFISTVTFPTVEEANNGSYEHNGNTYQYGEAPVAEGSALKGLSFGNAQSGGGALKTFGKINDVYGVAYSATEAFVGSTIILTNKLSKASNLMKGVKILKKVPAIGPLGIASDFFDAGLDAYNGDIAKSALKFGLIALKNGIRFSSPVGFAIITAIDLSVSAYDIYKDVKND